jgi:hypothetical protein
VDIEAPADGATVGFHPSASGEFGCANCELARAWVSEGDPLEPIGPIASFGIPHPGPFHVSSLDTLTDAPGGLAGGTYGFEVEVIDGAVVSDQTFGGDAGGIPFVYLSGTSELATVDFTVPEAGGTASAWVAATALAGCARVRGTRRRRR